MSNIQKELKIVPRYAKKIDVDLTNVDQRVNTQLRKAIRNACGDLQLGHTEIELAKESAKTVWEKIKPQTPVYALFKSDRTSSDQDPEAQDPLKTAVLPDSIFLSLSADFF